MLSFKVFYFFYIPTWSGMCSYFPIYLKQLGLSASYAGILAGLAPILRGVGAIVFGFVADKTEFWKFILLVSLAANAITPVLYAIPQQEKGECDIRTNDATQGPGGSELNNTDEKLQYLGVRKHISYNGPTQMQLNKSMIKSDEALFWILLAMVTIGEFLCGPARSMVDAALLQALGDDSHHYGAFLLWGNVGQFPSYMFVTLLAITIPQISCDSPFRDNYAPAMFVFSCYRVVAFASGLAMKFEVKKAVMASNDDHGIQGRGKIREVIDVLLTFRNSTLIIIVFYLGMVDGQFWTFMFWYVNDISPSQATWVMGVAGILRCSICVITYGSAGKIFKALGIVNTIHCCLLVYVVAYVTYGLLQDPWLAMIPEALQAVAYPLSLCASVVYFGEEGHSGMASTMQGM